MIIKTTHPFLSNSMDVRDILKPLQELGIIYFTYEKSEKNGSRTYLSTHPDILEKYLKEEYYLIGNVESSPDKYKNQILFWDTLPKQYIYDDVIRSSNIDHGIFMIHQGTDYCEFYGFAAKKGNHQVINNYINHVDVLKNFCPYFKDRAKSIIRQAEAHKIMLPFHNDKLDFVNDSKNIIFNDILTDQKNILLLSVRQKDCATLLLKGMQYKEIAQMLNISSRTVETHINYLKRKLNCSNKIELILQLSIYLNY